jgi:hypothetical protein
MTTRTTLRSTLLAVLVGVLLALGCLTWSMLLMSGRTPIYTVTALRQQLARDPDTWAGRTVLLRGQVLGCGSSYGIEQQQCAPAYLVEVAASGEVASMPLDLAGPDRLRSLLRRLPLLGRLVPAQALQWGALVTYRVRLRAGPDTACAPLPCLGALLLDSSP